MAFDTYDEITRLQNARNTFRTKFVELGIASSSDKLDALAQAAAGIINRGAVDAEVREGETYTVQRGWHAGGTVKGIGGGGSYTLQAKGPIAPTKSQQSVTADDGYYGLSNVLIGAIPSNYNDTSSVTASAADVLTTKIIVGADGSTIPGTMPNNGKVTKALDSSTTSYTIAKGYHNGEGKVSVTTETKTATPTKSTQNITATTGKLMTKVTVEPIPAEYISTAGATATKAYILAGYSAYVDGVKLDGEMPNNGEIATQIDGLTVTSVAIPAGYTSGGTITLDDTIAEALAAI